MAHYSLNLVSNALHSSAGNTKNTEKLKNNLSKFAFKYENVQCINFGAIFQMTAQVYDNITLYW